MCGRADRPLLRTRTNLEVCVHVASVRGDPVGVEEIEFGDRRLSPLDAYSAPTSLRYSCAAPSPSKPKTKTKTKTKTK